MEVVEMNVGELIPYGNNPRKNTKAVKYVAESIEQFGFKVPIIIDKDNIIVTGHTRLRAAKSLGMETVPVIQADDLTDEQVKAFRLADNKTGEMADWDLDMLALEMMEFDKADMEKFGFEFEFEGEAETEEEIEKENMIKEMEIKQFEHHDYLVFVFDNQQDWLSVVSKFDIKRVDAGYGKTKKVGVGRVLDGKRLLEEI